MLLLLSLLACAAAFVEALSVASIMPFLAAIASPDLSGGNSQMSALFAAASVDAGAQTLALLGGLVLLLLVLSNALSAFTTWALLRFANREGQRLAVRLLESYLERPYTFYLNRNSSELHKNIFSEVQRVTHGLLVPGVQVVSKACVVLFMLLLLFAVDVKLAFVVGAVLGGAYYAVYRHVRSAIHVSGRQSVETGTLRARFSLEALSAVKEIKLLARETDFVRRFERPALDWADAQAKGQALGQLPKFAVESVAFAVVLLVAIYLLAGHDQARGILPVLGVYTFAGYRLMPALQRVFGAWASIRQSGPAVEIILRDLSESGDTAESRASVSGKPMLLEFRESISLDNVTYRYPGATIDSLSEISLTIPKYSCIAFVGATGSGKTSVVDLLMGLLPPASGSIRVDNVAVDGERVRAWQSKIGHVPQQIFLCDDTIANNIAFGLSADRVDRGRVESAARQARLHEFVIDQLPDGYDTVIGDRGIRLSGGQRQRIGIARALYHDREVLVLDEATSSLDNITEGDFLDGLRALTGRKTIIMIAHRLSTVRDCNQIFLMEHGRIVDHGTYDELMRTSNRFRALAAALPGDGTPGDLSMTGAQS